MIRHLDGCAACAAIPDYLVCRDCGAHFLTSLEHGGLCFDCRDEVAS